ncbi:hypothetical protein BDZ89DRAFT_1057777 [Hymenopellis radicata]|nr:hypothetical protein BDZ89DRAFT_1057777 [Hymenopellis radicata]
MFSADNDEDRTLEAVALIISASHDPNFAPSLREIYQEICQNESLLDPLNMLPPLLESSDPAASDLLALIGECGTAKEVLIGVEEAVEKLKHHVGSSDFDEDTEKPNSRLSTLLGLYSAAIPRVKHRQKSPQETLMPIVTDLASTMSFAGSHANTNEGRAVIVASSNFVRKAHDWVLSKPDLPSDDRHACQALLKSVLDSTITTYSPYLHASLADRTFVRCYPRLSFRTKLESGWEDGADAISNALSSYDALGVSPKFLVTFPSPCHFILVAHSKDESIKTPQTLSSLLSIILGFIQANNSLDESISFLLTSLHSTDSLSTEIAIPLCTVLPALASGHPDPSVRHQTFRILSKILASTDPAIRLQILHDLCSHSEFPQMRVAAVGLVKEAILEAFGASIPNLFSSPRFLQVLGPTIFRPDPLDFFESHRTLEKLQESSEPARLVECLALLYVLILRDQKNKTGIRDWDNLNNIDKQLLNPIRAMLAVTLDDPEIQNEHVHDIMSLVSLKTALERVEVAVESLTT